MSTSDPRLGQHARSGNVSQTDLGCLGVWPGQAQVGILGTLCGLGGLCFGSLRSLWIRNTFVTCFKVWSLARRP